MAEMGAIAYALRASNWY